MKHFKDFFFETFKMLYALCVYVHARAIMCHMCHMIKLKIEKAVYYDLGKLIFYYVIFIHMYRNTEIY